MTTPTAPTTPHPTGSALLTRVTRYCAAQVERILGKTPSTGEVFPELDGIRGLAVLLVLASHTNLWNLRGVGAVGVWLFYVLSSFLLTRIIRKRLPGSLSPGELCMYVVRRIARVIPTYYAVLAVVAIIDGKPLDWFLRHCVFMLADGHFWSIPQEELFYVLLPLIAAVVYLAQRWLRLPAVIVAALLLWLGLEKGFPFFQLPANGGMSAFYVSVFLVGFLLAHVWELKWFQRALQFRVSRYVANLAGLLALASFALAAKHHIGAFASFTQITVTTEYPAWTHYREYAAICAVLIVSALIPGSWMQHLFACKPMRVVGTLSFGIYLVHHRILEVFARPMQIPDGIWLFLLTFLSSFAVALVLERWLESPSMQLGRRLNRKIAARFSSARNAEEKPYVAAPVEAAESRKASP